MKNIETNVNDPIKDESSDQERKSDDGDEGSRV